MVKAYQSMFLQQALIEPCCCSRCDNMLVQIKSCY